MMSFPLPEDRPPTFARSAIAGLLAGVGVLPCPCPAHPVPDAGRPPIAAPLVALPALPPGSRYLPLGEAVHIQGLPLHAYVFEAPLAPAELASWLTDRQPALRDLWVMRDAVVLAGVADGLHWVARFGDAGVGRTQGTISALPIGGSAASVHLDTPDAAAWRLPGGRMHFEVRSRDDDAVVVQQVWTHGAAPAALRQRLASQLAKAGWTGSGDAVEMPEGANPGGLDATRAEQRWSRGRLTLHITIVPLDQGSGVTAVIRIGA